MLMFIVIGPNCWGRAETQKAAYQKARSYVPSGYAGKRMPFVAYQYDEAKVEAWVDDIFGNLEWRTEDRANDPVVVDAWGVSDSHMKRAKAYKEAQKAQKTA